jgi:DNA-binding transcriptional regulator YhcF (GntR family)
MTVTSPTPTPRRRSANRTEGALSAVREMIVRGKWQPGDQLPKRLELKRKLGVSMSTIQSALDRLIADGFVHVEPTKGTFVHHAPPHLNRIALAFSYDLADDHPSRWVQAFKALSSDQSALDPNQIAIYQGVKSNAPGLDYLRLIDDIREHRVAGIIFGNGPEKLLGTPLLEKSDLPKVAITGDELSLPSYLPRIHFDHNAWITQAVTRLAQQGCKRPAILWHRFPDHGHIKQLRHLLPKHSMVTRETWWQCPGSFSTEQATRLMHLMMDRPSKDRPDCLIIADEHLLVGALEGISRAGLSVPGDIKIVSHATFPVGESSRPEIVHVDRLGFSAKSALDHGIRVLDAWRKGQRRFEPTLVAPCFVAAPAARVPGGVS